MAVNLNRYGVSGNRKIRIHVLIIISIQIILSPHCSLIEPDHNFPIQKPHSYDPGSSTLDSIVVLEILKLNGISADKFSSVATVEKDWRIHSLRLRALGIDTLPDIICELGALDELDLANNKLRSLPDSIVRLKIIYADVRCSGPCGSADCCNTYLENGLVIKGNALCNVSSSISSWIDSQFGKKDYLQTDTSQRCF
jgi:Leucine-rich repeat (LRR) protein